MKKITRCPPVAFLLDFVDTYSRVGVGRSAAALSYFLILTLFPLLLCANYFIGLFHLDLARLFEEIDQLLPSGALSIINDYLGYVSMVQSPTLFWLGVVTIIISASAGLRTLFQTMRDLYGLPRPNPVAAYLPSIILSFLLMPTIYLSVVVIFTGGWFFHLLEERLPWQIRVKMPLDMLSHLWSWLRYLLLFCFFLLLVLIIYRVGTPRDVASGRGVLLPAFWTSVSMVGCSGLFSWFIGMSSRYALVYGSLASLIILLVWLYLCSNILLIGAVVGRLWNLRNQS